MVNVFHMGYGVWFLFTVCMLVLSFLYKAWKVNVFDFSNSSENLEKKALLLTLLGLAQMGMVALALSLREEITSPLVYFLGLILILTSIETFLTRKLRISKEKEKLIILDLKDDNFDYKLNIVKRLKMSWHLKAVSTYLFVVLLMLLMSDQSLK